MTVATLPATPPARRARLFRLAWRESRTARRRLLLYMSSISLGVAALVAIDSFTGNVRRSIREQSRALLGGDLSFTSGRAFPRPVDSLFDSLTAHGARLARVTTFGSMASVPRTSGTRLVQVRAVTPAYPVYGEVETVPALRWGILQQGAHAVVDPSLLAALEARVGDSLTLGYRRFLIVGTIQSVPGDPGLAGTLGPRVFIPERYVPETRLLVFGARAEYEALVGLPTGVDPTRLARVERPRLERERVRVRTATQNEQNLTDAIDQLGRFLGVVGIVALLLGGVGVASGVHAFVVRKVDTVAVLRCLGATTRQVLTIYVTQAALMGLAGAAVGAAAGVVIQLALPHAFGDFLPVDVSVRAEPLAIATGLLLGVWVALAFALRPLLALRSVSPLQAIRHDTAPALGRARWHEWPSLLVNVLVAGSVVLVAATRSRSPRETLFFSLGIGAAVAVLWASAAALSAGARRLLRSRWPYVVRQGVANLYRPQNQTRAVVLALGFGAFLITTLYLVQANLLRQFGDLEATSAGNLVLYDIQDDQAPTVDSILGAQRLPTIERTPLVTMRVAAVGGRPVAAILADSARRRSWWAFRREYRSTYRDAFTPTERVVAGRPFGRTPARPGQPPDEVSLERGVAQDLGVRVGDEITWDVQGVKLPTRVTSLREVRWATFQPNFFAVFSPGAIARAPKQYVLLTRVADARGAARLLRAVVDRFPNVAGIDLILIRRTIEGILRKVSLAVRFLAIFSVAMGVPVLFSAVAATRRERVREGVLLKTLGATRQQIRAILLAEYALLGLLGALTGLCLAFGGAWLLMRHVFHRPFAPTPAPALAIGAGLVLLAVTIGLLSGRDVFRETPMAALREG